MTITGINIGSLVAIYFVIWWVSLFVILPFGVRPQLEDGTVTDGTEPGAPVAARMLRKVLYTSLLAAAVMAAWLAARAAGVTLDNIPLINRLMP